jgi:multimeric flavodoxin WrbA
MSVIVKVKENSISITNDPKEKVYGLYYTNNNSCSIPDDDVKTICKIGEQDCCIFCSLTGSGFECQKFNSTAKILLDRHSKGTMKAKRIGNCEILGRKDL